MILASFAGYELINATDAGLDNATTEMVPSPVAISASPVDPKFAVVYGIASTNPPGYLPYLSVDPVAGYIMVNPSAPGPFVFNNAWTHPAPLTIYCNVSATSMGVPPIATYTRLV